MKKQNGITLVALVITIIILIILAAVSINLILGQYGVVTRAKEAKEQTEITSIKEEISLKILDKQTENKGQALSNTILEDILKSYGTVIYEEDGKTVKGVKTKKEYEILLSEIYSGAIEDKGPTFTTVANAPDISGFNKSNTYYVAWNLSDSTYVIDDTTLINKTAPSNWYDYTAGENKWANVKTTGGENDCYWVWIPRYAYKVPTRSSEAQTIDIKFLKDDTNIPIDGSSIIISNNTTEGSWNVHPAFWWDKDNDGIQDEGEQLSGIWVAKFEASSSSSSVVENPTAAQLAIDGGSDADIDLKIRVRPNVTSWRNITVNNIFTVCRNLTTSGNSLEGASNIDSHMMKNTEWGAVAYLSRSVYGKNSQVWNNPYYNNTTNYSPITGLCGKGENKQDLSTTNLSDTCKYNENGGENASTSGNVYGVYDMAGGAWEYVAGYLNEVLASNSALQANSQSLYNADLKYKDIYVGNNSTDTVNYGKNTNKYGDAMYETSTEGTGTKSWDSDFSYFVSSSIPLLLRGGRASYSKETGIFAFSRLEGRNSVSVSFRPCLVSPK